MEINSHNVTHGMLATQVKAFHEHFRPHYNERTHMVWPPLSGEDWGRLVEDDSRLLRYLGDWEEFEHRRTQCRFWRDTILVEQETAVRKLQLLFRQFWFIKIPPPGEWRSKAYTFTMPEPVKEQERQRTGWALLRRRGKLLREVTDVDRRVWEEYMDPVGDSVLKLTLNLKMASSRRRDAVDAVVGE